MFVFLKPPLGPEKYVIELIYTLILKQYFFNAGRTFDVFKIMKNPLYTLNIDRITKPQNFVKIISMRHMKQKRFKNNV